LKVERRKRKVESKLKVENCFLGVAYGRAFRTRCLTPLHFAKRAQTMLQSLTQQPELFIRQEFLVTPQTRSAKKKKRGL
jgi:hypothetical protein